MKYDINEVANETLPVPEGSKTLETYGKVISGNINEDIVNNAFITKFFFIDFCFSVLITFYSLLSITFVFLLNLSIASYAFPNNIEPITNQKVLYCIYKYKSSIAKCIAIKKNDANK